MQDGTIATLSPRHSSDDEGPNQYAISMKVNGSGLVGSRNLEQLSPYQKPSSLVSNYHDNSGLKPWHNEVNEQYDIFKQ